MAKNKTTETTAPVIEFINAITDESRRKDVLILCEAIRKSCAVDPRMWGSSIIGFGAYHYKYESGHEGDAPLVGMASRVNAIVLYLSTEFDDREKLLTQLGKHKTGKGCIYIQKVKDIDLKVLMKMTENSYRYYKKKYKSD